PEVWRDPHQDQPLQRKRSQAPGSAGLGPEDRGGDAISPDRHGHGAKIPRPTPITEAIMANPATKGSTPYGVHSEVGKLRKVLVCSPGLAHKRLTPSNKDKLLFDELPWVEVARRDHQDFVNKMRERGVEVVEKHQFLAETLDNPAAKKWLLDKQIT